MVIFTFKKGLSKLIWLIAVGFILLFGSVVCSAQSRDYTIIYSGNLKGGTTIFGNTLLSATDNGVANPIKMNDNSANGNSVYGNDFSNMQNIDIDGDTGNGSITRNSSSSDLILPAGNNEIKMARLYWGGCVLNSEFDLKQDGNKKIKLRKGTANEYADITAAGIDKIIISNNYTQYQAYADITSFVQSNGAGTYEAGNAPLSTGIFTDGGYNGGWSIVVVYENDAISYNSIRVYDGFKKVYNSGNALATSIVLTGLNVPSGELLSSDAKMGVLVWEGDAKFNEDFFKINGNLFANETNWSNNPWNGTITDNGIHVTTKNPNYTNQMGIDIDQFDVGTGYGIHPNDTSVTLQFGTRADQYFPGLITFSVKTKDSVIGLRNNVAENGPLPVSLLFFTGTLMQNDKVALTWSTSMEINCSQFKVERSPDGKVFYEVGAVAGNGTTFMIHSYTNTDNIYSFTGSIVYYRLKQLDADNKASYSKIVAIKLANAGNQICIFPNPFITSLNINMEWKSKEIIILKLVNISGDVLFSKSVQMQKGVNAISFQELSKLSAGNYFIQFVSSSQTITKKICKQ